jgi:hypothetical protein
VNGPVRVAWRSGTLGVKVDECPRCGQVGRHRLERQVRWLEVGPVGVLPLGLRHGLECASCWSWTPMRAADVRSGTRTGRLPLPDRPRPVTAAAVAAGGAAPDFDRVLPSRGLDGATAYMGVWLLVVAILVGLALQPKGIEGAHDSGGSCLVVVGLAPGQPLPTQPLIVSDTLCALPHNFEPVGTVPLTGYAPSATPPPYAAAAEAAAAGCQAAFKAAFGSPPPGGPELVVIGPDPRDWARGDRHVTCAAGDPANAWLPGPLPR